jgi:sugar phosphate isomerase/epimerase
MKRSRRTFIKQSGAAIASAAVLSQIPVNLFANKTTDGGRSFGFQVWTIRKKLIEDFAGTLKEMKEMGYSEVEMCSPLGYSMAGFKPLHEIPNAEMRKIIDDAGLKCTSSHFNMMELRDNLDNRIEWAHAMGMKQMMLAIFPLRRDATLDDFRKAAQELNAIGEKVKAAGIQMGFHNHHVEFAKRGDQLIYDVLLEEFDPDLIKMQFQVAVVDQDYHAADYFRKYPGRFISAHLADWSSEKDSEVPVGQGVVDWDDFFKAAEVGGVKNFFVEMAPDTFEPSAEFLKRV